MELLCPAGNLPALKTAIDCGADAVYIGFKDDTNARHFAGLNFTGKKLEKAIDYVHDRDKKLHIALNTFAHPDGFQRWTQAVDQAAALGVDALIIADIAILDYAAEHYPELELHLSVQASATNVKAIEFYQKNFNVKRIVLPRVLSIHQVKQLSRNIPSGVELEVFAFGSLCIMSEGRCYLSSYMTGESPNTVGACSPAKYVRWQETELGLESRLNDVLIDRYACGENAGYPTLCKGRFISELEGEQKRYHALEEPTSLNTLSMLPELFAANVASVKIEGRQRSPAYVEQVTRTWRAAIDHYLANPEQYQVKPAWDASLANVSEGTQTTLGAYHRKWQ
ncbi:U32 family peptidase [Vibrio cincinnatiensis]|uniref:ubiquinone anaerobic biosynthesis protein UbiU n=1 Tax=Vibrio cincinnatiensis TaxID=675 RepID=UPI001EDEC1D2|nr:peptidase U32 family protein [Vibrio cincinnatiensis]MCG3721675.1 U32 family peptidase [Vibrio cincinnatiensis]MCG3724590.1 U32 family peptidase [Vibrio cincinnatiensis]MCG3731521.1 U32 family peptidase [Vibrio cincinnatiensis]MCG3735097.1 U32 family peptidase [Vibrio cincinnatiensis]MCG3739216.1 U32 family peptidase [Vibrio cincinnatiensis]